MTRALGRWGAEAQWQWIKRTWIN